MELHTVSGGVSQYGLACGYIQRSSNSETRVDLYREHNTYFVRLFVKGRTVFHEGFPSDKLREARVYYRKLVEAIK